MNIFTSYEKNQLRKYAEEMNSSNLSIDVLINSHRYLRTQEKLKMSELKKYCEEGREKALQQTLDSSWIEVSKLKK